MREETVFMASQISHDLLEGLVGWFEKLTKPPLVIWKKKFSHFLTLKNENKIHEL